MIAMKLDHAVTDVRLFDDRDLPWIDDLMTLVEQALGQPWRVLLERIDNAALQIGGRPVSARWRQAITNALRRVLGGRAERTRIARRLRAKVLGHPALEPAERAARIANAADELGIAGDDVESLLWADLARERPVVLPNGRPDSRRLAALANVDRIQRELRRARELELRIWGNAHGLVRMAARCGLITRVTREPAGTMLLRVAGPLALFHATTVYGRALGALVPLLAEHPRFELDIHCDFATGPHTRRVLPPVLLPPYTSRLKPSLGDWLARALVLREHEVNREPAPLAVDQHVVFPDLSIDHAGTRWFVEVIGFSTADYLADKLALYRAANARVILCVDAKRSIAARPEARAVTIVEQQQPSVLAFEGRIDADALIQIMEEEAP